MTAEEPRHDSTVRLGVVARAGTSVVGFPAWIFVPLVVKGFASAMGRLGGPRVRLLQTETFVHQSLQARPVDQIVGKLFIGKHAQGGAPRIGGHF